MAKGATTMNFEFRIADCGFPNQLASVLQTAKERSEVRHSNSEIPQRLFDQTRLCTNTL